jgi:hypothetical protein
MMAGARGPGDYHFGFTVAEKSRIKGAPAGLSFVVLVCGDEAIAGVSRSELDILIDLDTNRSESITLLAESGKQLRVWSTRRRLTPKPRNAFPSCVLS